MYRERVSFPSSSKGKYVPDFNIVQPGLLILFNVDVDREMCINIAHLIAESFCYPKNHVIDDCSDGAKRSDGLPDSMVELNIDDVLLWVRKGDGKMAQVFGEFACHFQ